MIYFKCSVGLFESSTTPPSNDVANISFDDVDKYLSIATISSDFTSFSAKYENVSASFLSELVSDAIGDISSLYCEPAGYGGGYDGFSCYDLLMSAFPSIQKMFPNCYSKIMNNPSTVWWVHVYLPSLKRYFIGGVDGGPWYIYNVTEQGKISSNPLFDKQIRTLFGYAQGNIDSAAVIILPCLVYENDDSILDVKKYNGISLYIRKINSQYLCTYSMDTSYYGTNLERPQLAFNALFGYSHTPDRIDPIIPPSDDPYGPGGTTGPGGGTGTFDEKSDPVEIPNLPSLSASDTGLVTLFNPSLKQIQQLASYLWSDLFDITAWKKIFADPMDAILGLSIVPVAVPNVGAVPIKVGNIATDVLANKATSQFVEVDCGSVDVTEYWGAYLDYDPYTKVELYLPYIGVHPLTTDDVMGKSVRVVYHVDVLSGACCAYVKCGTSVLYSFVGQCSCSIPITGSDWTNVINGAINIAASIGSMVATGGATAPMAVADIASTAVNSMKPTVEKSGSISGTGGLMGLQTPYLILTRPRQAIPENQNRYSGYPSFITRKLEELVGYTEVDSIHLENIPATEQELSEIESLLKGGVLL